MEHRVAITGIGAVTPLGNTAPATWEAMLAGRCGIGPITRFDAEGFAVQVAAEVKGFDGEAYFGRREARHLGDGVRRVGGAVDEDGAQDQHHNEDEEGVRGQKAEELGEGNQVHSFPHMRQKPLRPCTVMPM